MKIDYKGYTIQSRDLGKGCAILFEIRGDKILYKTTNGLVDGYYSVKECKQHIDRLEK